MAFIYFQTLINRILQQTEDCSPTHTTPTPGTPVPSTPHDVRPATPEPSRLQPQTTRGRIRSLLSDESYEVLQEAILRLKQQSRSEKEGSDDDPAFGCVVANDLRKMNEENKIHAQKLISDVLFLGKLGKLSFSSKVVE